MIRALLYSIPLYAMLAAFVWAVWAPPAFPEEAKPLPYTCLPAEDADAVHFARGDVLVASRNKGRFIDFLWRTKEGEFLHASFDRATFRACAIRLTPYDPRDSISG